jgi:hypothetical protein
VPPTPLTRRLAIETLWFLAEVASIAFFAFILLTLGDRYWSGPARTDTLSILVGALWFSLAMRAKGFKL